jgi:hypothetical protein
MRPFRHLLRFAVVPLAALFAAGAAHAAVSESVLRGAWSEVTTPHVRVLSDAGPERARHVAERLERLHEQVARTVPALASNSGRPRTAFVFARGGAFRDYLPLYDGRPEEDNGLFQPGPVADWLLFEDGADADLDRVALHEYTHALLREVAPNAPVWLNEGLAQYFSTLRVDAADARVGEPAPECVAWLHGHDLLPMEDLLGTGHGSSDYHTGDRRGTFYAESWLLVHMLLNENVADLARWDQYLGALHRGDEPRAAFRASFGDERQLFWRLEVYAHRPSYGAMNWGFSQPFASLAVSARSRVPNAEVTAALGEMLLWERGADLSAAREHAAAALALEPGDPSANRLVASIASRAAAFAGGSDAAPAVQTTLTDVAIRTGVRHGGPLTGEERARLSALIHAKPAAPALAYLRALLDRDLLPGERRGIERLVSLLGPDAPAR